MRQRTLKMVLSTVCLVLTLCVMAYPAALAQETTADSSAASEELTEDAVDDAELAASVGTEGETEAADNSSGESEGETPTVAIGQQETVVLTGEADSDGWTQTETGWTFFYWENEADSEPTQAMDVVLYLEERVTNGETTFEAGYYYFNDEGELTLTGTGFVTAISLDTDGKALLEEDAETGGQLVTVTTTQNDSVYSSVATLYTGVYNGVYYSNGALYTGFYLDPDTEILSYITEGVPASYTGKYETSNLDTYGDTTFTGDGLWYYNGVKFTGYVRRYSGDKVWVVTDGVG
ncbi:MAG: hypothetical protein LUE89_02890, partial [Clostridiales bacterium]|nr:hypothetical protein [Clostridiales bacterium]